MFFLGKVFKCWGFFYLFWQNSGVSNLNINFKIIISFSGFQPVQMVAADETHPACSGLKMTGKCRDAAVEEALHLVNAHGHALAHPKVFGSKWTSKSKLTNALDKARFDLKNNNPT